MKVIGFGDSILKGAVLTGGPTLKYSLLQAGFLEQVCSGKGLELANHARFGSTITVGRSIFDRFFHTVGEGDVVVFEFGGNDCDFPWAKIGADADYPKEPFTPMDGFLSGYAEMIRLCREKGARPVPRCVNGPPLQKRNLRRESRKYRMSFFYINRSTMKGRFMYYTSMILPFSAF